MKKVFLLTVAILLSCIVSKAQSFFELDYFDKNDNQKYVGLMTYFDEDIISLRCVYEEDVSQYFECDYSVKFKNEGAVKYMIIEPKESDEGFPIFVWSWKKKDQSDMEDIPVVIYKMSDLGKGKDKAESFVELSVSDMDEDYIAQFYEKDEEMFKIITDACNLVRDQDKDIADYDIQEGVQAGDGSAVMHFIMVAATKDETIGPSVETDLNLVEPEFKKFAKQLNIGFEERIVKDYDFGKPSVERALSNLQIGSNDIIVFVYSGHGFRFDDTSEKEDPYPNMCLTYNGGELTSEDYASISEVYDLLVKKGARLTIVISDCCNSKYGATRAEVGSSALVTRGSNNYDVAKLKKLFLESSGSMKVTAAKAGQFALCDSKGGFLLTSFLNNLHNQISATTTTQPSWQTIIENASKFVKKKTTGFDETGADMDPQIVVRSINIKQADGSVASVAPSDNSGDTRTDGIAMSQKNGSEEGSDLFDFACIGIVIAVILVLAIVIIKLIKKKKN